MSPHTDGPSSADVLTMTAGLKVLLQNGFLILTVRCLLRIYLCIINQRSPREIDSEFELLLDLI